MDVAFDDTFSVQCHYQNLVDKLSGSIRILAKVKLFLNAKALFNIYHAMFHSRLQYGLIAGAQHKIS